MFVIERSAVVPQGLEEAWETFFGNELKTFVDLADAVVAVTDYQLRPDGTPTYVMHNKMGPMRMSHRSDYFVWEPPHRSVDRVLDSVFGGTYHIEHESVDGGTRVSHRWEIEIDNPVARLLFPLLRPVMARRFQGDLDKIADRIRERQT